MNLTPLDPWLIQKTGGVPLSDWQLDRLNETLSLVRRRSAFYRARFAGLPETLSSLSGLQQFPFTTPDDLRANPLRFVCVSQDEIHRVVTLQSSGTTGEPKRIFFTASDQELTIDFFGVGMSTLTLPGERVMILLPGETPGSVGDLLRQGLEREGRIPIPYGPVRDPLHALDHLHAFGADCLVGSPTQVLGLARRWKLQLKAPRTVLLSTDYVPAAIVRVLENIWGCRVFNHYGATEMGLGGGVECEAHAGYHLREADLLFEVVDPVTGQAVPDGDYGEVVITTLTHRGMPLVRYRMGDRSRFLPGQCPCGTQMRLLESVCGRFSGYIPLGNHVLRLPDLDEALFPIPGLLNFTVTLTSPTTMLVEAFLLSKEDCSRQIHQALETVPACQGFGILVLCKNTPEHPGSLLKRFILDQRGDHA